MSHSFPWSSVRGSVVIFPFIPLRSPLVPSRCLSWEDRGCQRREEISGGRPWSTLAGHVKGKSGRGRHGRVRIEMDMLMLAIRWVDLRGR
jgi:hypothetical protein